MVSPPDRIFPHRQMGTSRAATRAASINTAQYLDGERVVADTEQGTSIRRRTRYSPRASFSAATGAKYVRIPSAPARLKPTRLSIIARSPSIQPLLAAPAIIAYSPDTW